jgi:tRNA-splicing ligase RtcB
MGAKSYIVRGKGNQDSFQSCAHGAGRRMSRGEAKRRFSLQAHAAATSGIECRKDAGVIDETPMAYKDIDAVMAAQTDGSCASRVEGAPARAPPGARARSTLSQAIDGHIPEGPMQFGVDVGPGEANVLETGIAQLLQRTPLLADLHHQLERENGSGHPAYESGGCAARGRQGKSKVCHGSAPSWPPPSGVELNLSFALA